MGCPILVHKFEYDGKMTSIVVTWVYKGDLQSRRMVKVEKSKLQITIDMIYNSEFCDKDFAAMIRQIHRSLSEEFRQSPPSVEQKLILDQLLKTADQLEKFHILGRVK